MSKTVIEKDFEKKTLTVRRAFAAPQSLVWKYCTGGELQAKWWGPEHWPATSVHHDFRPGGYWHYFMKGPDGTEAHGRMDYAAIDAENSYEGRDSFCDAAGTPSAELPSGSYRVELTPVDGGTLFTTISTYATAKDIETLVAMGVEEGLASAMDNLEKVLVELKG